MEWIHNLTSKNTRIAYQRAWVGFLQFLMFTKGGNHPSSVTMTEVVAYRHRLHEDGYSDGSVNLALAAITSFYDYAVQKQLTVENPAKGVKRFNVTKYGKATWIDYGEGLDKDLLASIPRTTVQEKRDYALLLLFLVTAMRVNEAAQLRIGDIHRQGRRWHITFTAKGNKTRTLKLPTVLIAAIQDYFQARGVSLEDTHKAVFTAWDMELVKGRKVRPVAATIAAGDAPLSVRRMQQIVKERCDAVFGTGHGIRPHSLRHTALGKALANGATLQDMQQLAGHSDLRTSLIYAQSITGSANTTAAMLGDLYSEEYIVSDEL